MQLRDRRLRGLWVVEDDEGLALRPEVRLGDYIDDIAELGEDLAQGILQRLWFDALFEVLDVYPKESERVSLPLATRRGAMTRT